jgi:CRP-like cAMP-binding protein
MGVQGEDRSWTVDEIVPLLRDLSFFEGLPYEDLELAAGILERFPLEDGAYLFRQGDPGDAFYVVLDGAVELSLTRPSGEAERLAVRRPGEPLGEAALIHGGAHSANATAVGRTVLLRFDGDGFHDLLASNRFALRVLASMAKAQRVLDLRLSAQERLRHRAQENGLALKDLNRVMHRGLLPREAPSIPGFDVAVGTTLEDGDSGRTLWDHFQLKDGRPGLVGFAVLGEGLPPAHYLALARSLLRELARDQEDLRGLLARLNSALASAVVAGMEQFVEAGVLLPSGPGVEWAIAGRCRGGVIRRAGVFQELTSHGPALGMLGGFLYAPQRLELGAGDQVLVLTEASQGIFRGAADLVASLHGRPVAEVVSTLQRALKKARQGEASEVSVLLVRKQ